MTEPVVPLQPPTRIAWGRLLGILVGIVVLVIVLAEFTPLGSPVKHDEDIGGTMTLTSQDSIGHPEGAGCYGIKGYDDITEGAEVTVKDAAGKVIGVTALATGVYDSTAFTCTFAFAVTVPKSDFFRVSVSHRGEITVSEAEAVAKTIGFTLGS